MPAERKANGWGWALLAMALLAMAPAFGAVIQPKDSENVMGYLKDAQTQAIHLQKDAEDMNSFVWTRRSWQTDADKLHSIKGHVNELGSLLAKMNKERATASPWQQDAMDRIFPMLRELAGNVSAQLHYLNHNQNRLIEPSYRDYATANVATSEEMASMISDFVSYGDAKHKAERLGQDLELPGY